MITITINNTEHGFSGTYEFTSDRKACSFLRGLVKKYEKGFKVTIKTKMTTKEVQNLMRTALNKVAQDLGKTVKTLTEAELRFALQEIRTQYSGPRFWEGTADDFNFLFEQTFIKETERLLNLQVLMKHAPENSQEAAIWFAAHKITLQEFNMYKETFSGKQEPAAEIVPIVVPPAQPEIPKPPIEVIGQGVPKFTTVQEILDYMTSGKVLMHKKTGAKVTMVVRDEKYTGQVEVATVMYGDGKKSSINVNLLSRYLQIAA